MKLKIEVEGIDYSNTLGPWIGSTYKMIAEYLEGVLCENNIHLTKQQWLVLNFIKTHPGLNQNELALFINRDKTSVARFVATLEKKGYIKKETSVKDKRSKILNITQEGIQAVKTATPIIREAILKLQREVSEDEIKKTISSLQKIQEKIKILNSKNNI